MNSLSDPSCACAAFVSLENHQIRFPYLLPNVVGACLALLTMLLVRLILPASPITNDDEDDHASPTLPEPSEATDLSLSIDADQAESVERNDSGRPADELVSMRKNVSDREVTSVATPRDTVTGWYCSRSSDEPSEVHDVNEDVMDNAATMMMTDEDEPVGLLGLWRIRRLLILFAIFSVSRRRRFGKHSRCAGAFVRNHVGHTRSATRKTPAATC